MNTRTLVSDFGYTGMPFGVRLATLMTGAVRADYGFAAPANRKTGIATFLSSLKTTFIKWHEARATVRQLKSLDDRLLMDIGVERADIDALANGWK